MEKVELYECSNFAWICPKCKYQNIIVVRNTVSNFNKVICHKCDEEFEPFIK